MPLLPSYTSMASLLAIYYGDKQNLRKPVQSSLTTLFADLSKKKIKILKMTSTVPYNPSLFHFCNTAVIAHSMHATSCRSLCNYPSKPRQETRMKIPFGCVQMVNCHDIAMITRISLHIPTNLDTVLHSLLISPQL